MKPGKLLLDLLFPPKCVFCRNLLRGGQAGVCSACEETLQRRRNPIPGTSFRLCAAAFAYEGSGRDAIRRFKFYDHPEYAVVLGTILANTIAVELDGCYDVISWIPVSAQRLRARGYDQAGLLAEAAAKSLGTIAVRTLQKTKHNAAQSGMEAAEDRRSNVRGVYTPVDCEAWSGKRVLLIDDILTTGATMEEAASVLLTAGAACVYGAALAHTPKHG